jgi:hypothetical protein
LDHENNVVITDHWHGITFWAPEHARREQPCSARTVGARPPWIMVGPTERTPRAARPQQPGDGVPPGAAGVVSDHNIVSAIPVAVRDAAP